MFACLVSGVLAVGFGIYAKLAAQRDGQHPERRNGSAFSGTSNFQLCENHANSVFQGLSLSDSESTRKLLPNAMVNVPNGAMGLRFLALQISNFLKTMLIVYFRDSRRQIRNLREIC